MMSVSVAGNPKNRCRTTVAERMVETLAELPFIGDQVGLFRAQPGRSGRVRQARRMAQRSVRTGPGLTTTKLILSLPYCAASASVKFCPAAFAGPGAISQ